jgi:rare lipoprotein A
VIGAEERGLASWYGHPYHGRRTASGEVYDMHEMTAAHRSLPFDTWLHVENVDTGETARVRVNDRGPFVDGRVLDVSRAAGVALGLIGPGVAPVRLRVIAAPPEAVRPAADAGIFAVQVGAFTEETGARALQRQLSEAGFETYVRRADDGGRVLYRVRAGRFTTRSEAAAHAEQIRARGHPTIVVSD